MSNLEDLRNTAGRAFYTDSEYSSLPEDFINNEVEELSVDDIFYSSEITYTPVCTNKLAKN